MITLFICILTLVMLVKLICFTVRASWGILTLVLKVMLIILAPVMAIVLLFTGGILGVLVLAALMIWAVRVVFCII